MCGHHCTIKKHSPANMRQLEKEERKRYSAALVIFENQPSSAKDPRKKPRLRIPTQEWYCCCINVSGTDCPLCGGNGKVVNDDDEGEGEDRDCPVCKCRCHVGWFKHKHRQALSRLAQSRADGIEENCRPRTTSDNVDAFGDMMLNSLAVSALVCGLI